MPSSSDFVEQQLREAFPARTVTGVITPHECPECDAMRQRLTRATWADVPDEFAEEFADSLPLLSPDAYNAFLPIWLRCAARNPSGEAAIMVLINVADEPHTEGFTPLQGRGNH
jgi:hypothetical protein